MSKGIGRLMTFGIAKETSRGTAEAAAEYNPNFSEAEFDEQQEKAVKEQNFGVIEDSVDAETVKEWAEGSISAPIGDLSFGLILFAALGAVNSVQNADASTIVFDHTFSVAQSAQHQALSIFLDDPLGGQDYKHALGMIGSLTIDYELGDFIKFSADVMAKKGEDATLTPTRTTENCFRIKHATFKLAANLAGLGAAGAIQIKNLSLTIEKNLESDDAFTGDNEPADFLNKQFVITGEIEALWQNETDFKDHFIADTARALRIDLLNDDVVIGTAANPQLLIDLAKIKITEISRPITNDELVTQTVSFKAHYSSGDTEMIEAVLTNLVTSY